jgi:hypothetical protein
MLIYEFKPGAEEIYINCQRNTYPADSYVDLQDMVSCLDLYFSNLLDDVDQYLDRLYLPSREMSKSNSLFGQLDQDTLKLAIESLPEEHRLAIVINFLPSQEVSEKLQHLYVHSETVLRFDDGLTNLYSEGLQELAEEVRTLL